jgi:hypothetical protein
MPRITVKQLIEILQSFNPELEIWEELDTGYFPMEFGPKESILELFDISNSDYMDDVGKKVIKF